MCSYIVEKARLVGTAKGPGSEWMKVDTAHVYYDHPYEAQLDHALCVDFVCEAQGGRERVAIEISRESALELIDKIKARLPEFPNLELLKVRGHAGLEGNEDADALATKAVRIEDSSVRERAR